MAVLITILLGFLSECQIIAPPASRMPPQTRIKQAATLAKAHQYKQAAALMQYVCQAQPTHKVNCYRYGLYLAQSQQTDRAVQVLLATLARHPRYAPAHGLLAHVFLKQGQFKRSVWHSLQALKSNPKDAQSMLNLGHCYAQLGQHQLALPFYKQAQQIQTKNPSIYYYLALSYAHLQRYQAALHQIETAQAIDPARSDYVCLAGEIEAQIKKYAAATSHLHNCLKKQPNRPTALFRLAIILLESNQVQQAYHTARKLQNAGYQNKALPILMLASFKKKDYQQALSYCQQIRTKHIVMVDLDYFQGLSLAQSNQHRKAISYYKKALNANPDTNGLYYNYAVSLARSNHPKQAQVFFQKGCLQKDRDACRHIKTQIQEQ